MAGGFQTLDPIPPPSGATLLRRFTLLSLGTAIVVGILFGTITARIAENFALRRQARATAAHVLELAGSRLTLQDFLLPQSARKSKFEHALRELVGQADIVHVTVWSRQGEVIYSNDELKSEQTPPPSTFLQPALGGQLQWQMFSPHERPDSDTRLLEVFVPVLVSGMPEPVAVFRVLSALSDLAPALARLIWSVEIISVLGVLILYAVLFAIVRAASIDLYRKESALRWAFIGIIRSLVNALDARDMATAHHSSRVASNAVLIARSMELDEDAVRQVQVAGYLHDVGKIGIRDDLLTKRGPLSDEDREALKRHTVLGFDILDPVSIPEEIKLAVRHSHERWDGQGYPDGLADERIPLAARIIAVADAYEALTTDRPYRRAQSPERAIEEIRRCAGTQFDPKVVDVALRVWQQSLGGQRDRVVSSTLAARHDSTARAQRAG